MFKNIQSKKYIFSIIVILEFLAFCPLVFSETILVLPENVKLEEINKDKKKKLTNRYENINQIEDQYKGKLKYIPYNNGINNYREGKFYTSVLFFLKGFPINNIDIQKINSVKSENSFTASFGYYFYDFLALELEYFEYIHSISNININGINKFKMDTKNFILNILIESNYSRFIPFLGFGIGALSNDFRDSNIEKLKGQITPTYQVLAGFEIALNESILINFKYRAYYNTIGDIKMIYDNNKYNIKFNWRNNFNIGFKYIW